mmetsp:Transcript_55309/g.66616  ORF Transcript_55309/g.66616 Transcript_55309/m.66616 type:complete len:477 (+) Transcript_55309:62-1492(+)
MIRHGLTLAGRHKQSSAITSLNLNGWSASPLSTGDDRSSNRNATAYPTLTRYGKHQSRAYSSTPPTAKWWPFGGNAQLPAAGPEETSTPPSTTDLNSFSSGFDTTTVEPAPTELTPLDATSTVPVDTAIDNSLSVVLAEASTSDIATTLLTSADFHPSWSYPPDQVIVAITSIHETTGLSYGLSILTFTLGIRTLMLPIFIKSQRNTSRMAHMKPEMDVMNERMKKLGSNLDQSQKLQMASEMNALFAKYDCHPIKAMALPLLQMPVFMSVFFGLKQMPDYYSHELSTGGMGWFVDLSATDPYHVLPFLCAGTFVGIIELGKTQMLQNPSGKTMLTAFRCMGALSVPFTMMFPTALFCYWLPNNMISLAQTAAFQVPSVRSSLGIWDLPKPVPRPVDNSPPGTWMEEIKKAFNIAQKKVETMEERNRRIDTQATETQFLKEVRSNSTQAEGQVRLSPKQIRSKRKLRSKRKGTFKR